MCVNGVGLGILERGYFSAEMLAQSVRETWYLLLDSALRPGQNLREKKEGCREGQ